MALLKFELTEDHLKLLKNLKWSINGNTNYIESIGSGDEHGVSPFGGDDIIEDMYLILQGKPKDFDPVNDDVYYISEEYISELKQLFSELPTAMDIIMFTGKFEVGHYKTKWYDRNWIKFTPKKITHE